MSAFSSQTADKTVKKFLSGTAAVTGDRRSLFVACDDYIRGEAQKQSGAAVTLAKQFVKRAQDDKPELRQLAYRSLGWVPFISGSYADSERAYLKARELSRGDASAQARIDRILIDVYMYLGDLKEARRRAKLAIGAFTRLEERNELAKTRVNYANLLHRQDRHAEAHTLYRQAGEHFKAENNSFAVALCYYNQANTLVQLFDFAEAERLYVEARQIFIDHDYHLWSITCLNGIAWLHMLQGDFHKALHELEECERSFREVGQRREIVLCQLDRAEVYLGLNLFVEARNMARDAGRAARKLGIEYETAKASFFFAKASFAMGRTADARRERRKAEALFKKLGNRAFLAATELLGAQIEGDAIASKRTIERAHAGFARAQLPLWEAICDLQILNEKPDDGRVRRRLSRNRAVKAVPHLLARWHIVSGEFETRRNKQSEAIRHWTLAADIMDAVRSKLPPVELRTAFSRGQTAPHKRLIQTSMETDPLEAAAWSERYKTAGAWAPDDRASAGHPARQRAEESLSELAAQVTELSSRFGVRRGERTRLTASSAKRLDSLKHKVRASLSAIEQTQSDGVLHIDSIKDEILRASRRQPIVQFHVGDKDIVAFVHDKKISRLYRYDSGVEILNEFVGQWRFLVERYANTDGPISNADLADERVALQRIGDWLWTPLEIGSSRPVLVIPDGDLANVPWQALIVDGHPIIDNHHLFLAPSLRHFVRSRGRKVRSSQIEVFVGSTESLGDPERDFSRVLSVPGVTVHRPCRRIDWPERSEARVWHYVGHAESRSDNPAYSCLWLEEGPMFAADFSLKRNRVELVTLAACRTGQHSNLPGEESIGLVRALLDMGAQNVIASHWAVKDETTAQWMDVFYSQYLNKRSLPDSYKHAALTLRERFPSAYNWGAFSIFGAGANENK